MIIFKRQAGVTTIGFVYMMPIILLITMLILDVSRLLLMRAVLSDMISEVSHRIQLRYDASPEMAMDKLLKDYEKNIQTTRLLQQSFTYYDNTDAVLEDSVSGIGTGSQPLYCCMEAKWRFAVPLIIHGLLPASWDWPILELSFHRLIVVEQTSYKSSFS